MKFGGIAFLAGLVIAIIIALFSAGMVPTWAAIVLAILGLVVGLLNITDREVQLFLVASIAFLITFQVLGSVITTLAFGWESVSAFFHLLSIFVAPAAGVVAIKALFQVAKE